jgi:arylsulfatase B
MRRALIGITVTLVMLVGWRLWRLRDVITPAPERLTLPRIAQEPPPNFLVVIADDLGAEKVGAYDPPTRTPATPRIDALAAEGRLFRNAYSQPTCSPTRATLLTGRDARHTGMGYVIRAAGRAGGLSPGEALIPRVLDAGTDGAYTSVAVGKWHVGNDNEGGPKHPNRVGFDHFAGVLGNILDDSASDGLPSSYTNWEKVTDGEVARTRTYLTRDNIMEARQAVRDTPEPWFLYVALSAPHSPYHVPPEEYRHTAQVDASASVPQKYELMVESVDVALGLTLDFLDHHDPTLRDRTWVFFLGDNGSPPEGAAPMFEPDEVKTTLLQGGVHIPLIVRGPGIGSPGTASEALVHTTDLLPTLVELAGIQLSPEYQEHLDGQSFAPALVDPADPGARKYVYIERFYPTGLGPYGQRSRALVTQRYKLLRDDQASTESLYRIEGRWTDGPDLLAGRPSPEDQAVRARLAEEMDGLSGPIGSFVRR